MNQKRQQQHEEVMRNFTTPRDTDNNPLLHDLWEPWARKVGYSNHGLCELFNYIDCGNTYFDSLRDAFATRVQAIDQFSWAIPCAEALATIAEASGGRVVEVGSGSGYWARLLQAKGVDVVAVDDGNEYEGSRFGQFFPETVRAKGEAWLQAHDGCVDRALFMCWPRQTEGDKVLAAFKGDTLIWVGETDGATWSPVDPEWECVKMMAIPNWPGIHDNLGVFKRKGGKSG